LFYRVDFRCDARDPLQRMLDDLYGYAHDPETRVLHRVRLNLFHRLLAELVADRVIPGFDAGARHRLQRRRLLEDPLRLSDSAGSMASTSTRARSRRRGGLRRRVTGADHRVPGRGRGAARPTPNHYDFVLCTEVIEHTARPERVVGNLAAALRPGRDRGGHAAQRVLAPLRRGARRLPAARKPATRCSRTTCKYPFWRALRLFRPHGLEGGSDHGANLWLDGRADPRCSPEPAARGGEPGPVRPRPPLAAQVHGDVLLHGAAAPR
jgi:SAM-dependent methyltransferase